MVRVKFAQPFAKLPILTKLGRWIHIAWGRRCEEAGNLPLGGWIDLATIHQGGGDKYFARPVKLPLTKFMVPDIDDRPHWFEVTAGQYIQGALLQYEQEVRIYIITIKPQLAGATFERWPRIIKAVG